MVSITPELQKRVMCYAVFHCIVCVYKRTNPFFQWKTRNLRFSSNLLTKKVLLDNVMLIYSVRCYLRRVTSNNIYRFIDMNDESSFYNETLISSRVLHTIDVVYTCKQMFIKLLVVCFFFMVALFLFCSNKHNMVAKGNIACSLVFPLVSWFSFWYRKQHIIEIVIQKGDKLFRNLSISP